MKHKTIITAAFVLLGLLTSLVHAQDVISVEGRLVHTEFPDTSVRDDLYYTLDVVVDSDAPVFTSTVTASVESAIYGFPAPFPTPPWQAPALVSAEYSIFETDGSIVADGLLDLTGFPRNFTLVRNEIPPFSLNGDFSYFSAGIPFDINRVLINLNGDNTLLSDGGFQTDVPDFSLLNPLMPDGAGGYTGSVMVLRDAGVIVEAIGSIETISLCIREGNHGSYVSCVAQESNAAKQAGEITGKEKGSIQRGAAKSK